MALKKEIVVNVDASKAKKGIDDLNTELQKNESLFGRLKTGFTNFASDIKKVYKEAEQQLIETDKQATKNNKTLTAIQAGAVTVGKGFSSGFKMAGSAVNGLGNALKGLGIGLIIAVVAKMSDAFKNNQKVTDALNVTFTTISIVLSEIVGIFVDMFGEVSKSTGGFDALRKVLGGALTVAINGIVIAIQGIVLGVKKAQLAWEESFLGDGDPKEIARLTKDINGLEEKIGETASRIASGAKDIKENFVEAVGEIGTLAQGIADASVKALNQVNIGQAIANAKLIEQNKKDFELLALQQSRLQLQFQRDAERQRQIRDDEAISIDERIKANDKLGEVLKKQLQAERATINARIGGLQQEQRLLGITQERTQEIFQLNTDLIDLQERVEGQQSEQLVNTNSLLKEKRELIQKVIDGEKERFLKSIEFQSADLNIKKELLQKDLETLEIQKGLAKTTRERIELEAKKTAIIEEQRKIDAERIANDRKRIEEDLAIAESEIERKRLELKEGTLARVEAEQEFLTQKQELDRLLLENTKLTADEEFKIKKDALEKELLFKQNVETAKIDLANNTFGLLGALAKKGSAIAKAVAIADVIRGQVSAVSKTISNTAEANAKAAALSPLTAGQPFVGINTASAALGIAGSIAGAVRAIKDINSESKSAGGGNVPTSGGGGAAAPSFNLVAGTGTNQIAEGLAQQRRPVQAFVVASNVTTAQSLDRNIINDASI